MTMPAPAPQYPPPGRPPSGLHYSWVIVGILVVVQVVGSAISPSAGVIVAPLRDPHGILSNVWITSTCYKPREIERTSFEEKRCVPFFDLKMAPSALTLSFQHLLRTLLLPLRFPAICSDTLSS
jgi:hypothetical protein